MLKQLFSKNLPKWFRVLNMCFMIPILFWPFVFYTTIFFFDNPKNLGLTYLFFFGVNAYPIYLLIIAYFNTLLFRKSKFLGLIFPTMVLLGLLTGITDLSFEMWRNFSQSLKLEDERKKQGYIGVSNDFRIINNKVYLRDTLIEGADAKTFEIVSYNWQRDKSYYYFFGKKIETIDRQSFKDLDYQYGKDKFNVYYDEKIIRGADAKSFNHIDGTQDGKDVNNCYRRGEKVDCEVLKIEE